MARYAARVPSSTSYSDMHDFELWRLDFAQVRFIGGFGKIYWLDAEELASDPVHDPLFKAAPGILAHMNEDHADALVLYCRAFKNVSPASAHMVGVDQFGFDVECTAPDLRLRFEFEKPATMETIRPLVVDMAKRARGMLEPPR
jgi:putative heme iron utilization protein